MKCRKMQNSLPDYTSVHNAITHVNSFKSLKESERIYFIGLAKKHRLKAVYKGIATVLRKRFKGYMLPSKASGGENDQ